jgi:hypothetical protein
LRFRVFLVVVAMAWSAPVVAPATAQPAAADEIGSVLWGAYTAGAPYDQNLLESLESSVGKHESIVHWGEPWMHGADMQPFQTEYFKRVRARGSIPMLTWGSWDSDKGTDQPAFRLAAIANGTYDGYITQWARDAKAWGQPFFLRFDHEMNGYWQFPWAEQLNGNHPGDYVAAWRHVHDIFVQQGVTNATWVWCPNISGSTTTPLNSLYPGDAYVDWTCMDGYNWGDDGQNTWQSFGEVFGGADFGGYNPHSTYRELLDIAPSKPIMLGEVASSEAGGSKAGWITDMLGVQLPTNFPQVKAVVWTNWNDGDAHLTWTIGSSASAASAFSSAIKSPVFADNQFGSLSGGVIQPPGGLPALTATTRVDGGTAPAN